MSSYMYVFVFKQKTAYEMRISDWSSDVCSSDLRIEMGIIALIGHILHPGSEAPGTVGDRKRDEGVDNIIGLGSEHIPVVVAIPAGVRPCKIGFEFADADIGDIGGPHRRFKLRRALQPLAAIAAQTLRGLARPAETTRGRGGA